MTNASVESILPTVAPAYAALRARVTDLVAGALAADRTAAERAVPACPEWRVRDVVGHLAGACEDVLAGRLDGVASEAWTEAQVSRHAEDDVTDLLRTWNTAAAELEEIVPQFPPAPAAQWVFDAVTHEQDLRGALGMPGARDSDAVGIGVTFLLHAFGGFVERAGLPSVGVRTEARSWAVGPEPAEVCFEVSEFELLRALAGRRTAEEVRALAVAGEPEPFLAFFADGPLRLRAVSLAE
jgi:uncharacterized protein (TIGR03083 family)